MKIQYLGTAAAEAIPGVFCECETCKKSRMLGGKNIRTRSQAIIDDTILVDFPADTYYHSIVNNIELSKISTCIITHSHSDHLYPAELWCRGEGIAHMNREPLTFYAAHSGYEMLENEIEKHGLAKTNRVFAKEIKPFEAFTVQGYTFTPLLARHDPASDPVIYIISKDGKNMLYANDTGYFPDETVEYLKSCGICFDLVSFDCTGGLNPDESYGKWGHLTLLCDGVMRDILRKNGNINDNTVCVVNHFSHNGTPIHEELCAVAEKEGYIVSYDGLTVEF